MVKVYRYTRFTNGNYEISERVGTREAIAKETNNRGVIIEESAQEVDEALLDANSFLAK